MICYRCLCVYSKASSKQKKNKHTGSFEQCCPACGCTVYFSEEKSVDLPVNGGV